MPLNGLNNGNFGHLSFTVHERMYRGRGAERWAESSSGARSLSYNLLALACTAARRDELVGTK